MKFAKGRTQSVQQPQHTATAGAASAALQQSPLMQQQAAQLMALRQGARQLLQRKQLTDVSQQVSLEEEEPIQGKFDVAQQAALEEEEPLQGKFAVAQQAALEEEEPLQGKFEPAAVSQRQAEASNNTGMPNQLKSGIESLSGYAMDDVKVHYNSAKPAQMQAHAYAQGTDIHLAPGQEQHLPHEAWHVVQQKQGRVKATTQLKGEAINDDPGLEHEADVMGARAASAGLSMTLPANDFNFQSTNQPEQSSLQRKPLTNKTIQLFDWKSSTVLTTIYDLLTSPSVEGVKDLVDPRRARLNPLNLYEGYKNYTEETSGGNYHSSSRHGAHNTVKNAMGRLQTPSAMSDKYNGGQIAHANNQGRFNSEAWESFSWRKAKELFENDIGVPVAWVPGPFPPAARSSWNVCLQHTGSDVGITSSAALAGAIQSVSGVKVAVNYMPNMVGGVDAYNGQMFPTTPAAPAAGVVRPGHPAGAAMNGTIQVIPYQFIGYFGI